MEDGKSGFLCQVQDEEDLLRKMQKFVNLTRQEREEMGRCGRRKMELEFDKKDVVVKTIGAIKKIRIGV